MAKFVCTKKCYHGGSLYRRGDLAKFTKASDGPKNHQGKLIHFEEIPEAKKVKKPRTSKEPKKEPGKKVDPNDNVGSSPVKVNGKDV